MYVVRALGIGATQMRVRSEKDIKTTKGERERCHGMNIARYASVSIMMRCVELWGGCAEKKCNERGRVPRANATKWSNPSDEVEGSLDGGTRPGILLFAVAGMSAGAGGKGQRTYRFTHHQWW